MVLPKIFEFSLPLSHFQSSLLNLFIHPYLSVSIGVCVSLTLSLCLYLYLSLCLYLCLSLCLSRFLCPTLPFFHLHFLFLSSLVCITISSSHRYSPHYIRFLHGFKQSRSTVRVRTSQLCASTGTFSLLLRGKGK